MLKIYSPTLLLDPFFGTVEQDFYWFHLPMKFSQKSNVSFITFYSDYDKNDPKYLGLFMIRKLP
jgi:hypothetical protein